MLADVPDGGYNNSDGGVLACDVTEVWCPLTF